MKRALKPEAAAELIGEGASLMIGGFMAVGTPKRMIDAIVARGVGGLTVLRTTRRCRAVASPS